MDEPNEETPTLEKALTQLGLERLTDKFNSEQVDYDSLVSVHRRSIVHSETQECSIIMFFLLSWPSCTFKVCTCLLLAIYQRRLDARNTL